ncbi:heavy-metal-associated domain-containing protein [Flagellimonas myxillae]|uniref:heavy-metal-associated domain-containing protein n=1 Tax=Flagellimonas myxillae TaxID=2942214 RepID=UPI00201F8C13|nr:heavy-metal-associated domain-containing protein [Muricauda myxillae]MCL6266957.1 heavy-metal-associated domain-containing protein [Muricauda myxillae]
MKTELQVQNLKCGGCANTITTQLSDMEDVRDVQVNPDLSIVMFEYDDEQTVSKVKEKLKTLGYPSQEDENGVLLKAKSYLSCAVGRFGN